MQKTKKKSQMLLVGLMMIVFGILYITSTESLGGENRKKEEQRLQSTLEETLEQMEGLGKVTVYFHYDEREVESSLAGYFSISDTQAKNESKLKGLLVVAEGAEDQAVRNELSQLLANVLQLPEHRIVIVEMKKRGNHLESK
ncbi:hypothetical protein ABZ756_01300 [Mammaliicoccus sciuri]|uniref:Stage III sporulation protein AG n=2 Tax=Sporosarcina newyorkensis TaxID=759851 RepID=A0A1T4XG87_9BACL|nr:MULTISPECIES: stage III sporulation protein AG [Sporosarcina]EGQ27764.1 stage III sporulation protein AG [Sporosarcina newyorkensis 2681]MBY0220883.1 hypothetical protein [Sporosarcina aquimarina]SKA88592.1 stage III sporulation protein AG [Sporosarcina newyorkensis]